MKKKYFLCVILTHFMKSTHVDLDIFSDMNDIYDMPKMIYMF